MAGHRTETDSLGQVEVAADGLWDAQTQRSLEHFSIGAELHPAGDDRRLRDPEESGGDRQSRRRASEERTARSDRPRL